MTARLTALLPMRVAPRLSRPVLTVAGLLLLLSCALLAVSSRPFSFFYSTLHDKKSLEQVAQDLNRQRADVALDYFRHLPKKTFEELQAAARPDGAPVQFTIAIITVSRPVPQGSNRTLGYVLQSAASLHSLVGRSEVFRNSVLFVCNVDLSPRNHADAALLKDYLPYVERYGNSVVPGVSDPAVSGTEEQSGDSRHQRPYDRERNDYTFCLQVAMRFRSRYYLIFQDDAIPHPDFPDVLDLSLAKLTKRQQCAEAGVRDGSPSSLLTPPDSSCLLDHPPYTSALSPPPRSAISPAPNSSFAYLKFYFPERWQGFAFELVRLMDLVSLGAVGGGLGLLLHACLSLRRASLQGYVPSWRAFLLAIALAVLLSKLIGRQNVIELRRVSKFFYRLQPSPSCCVPAMLYPAPVMPFLVTWLADSPDGSLVDLRISECFQHYQVPAYSVEPNVVRHVGKVTSISSKTYQKPVEEFVLFR